MEAPTLVTPAEDEDYWSVLRTLVGQARVVGVRVHDARIAAHGIRELWTADRDFTAFPSLRVRNPLIG